jgi:hypothetical protein
MKKTGLINRVHKGLRVWLFEMGTMAQQTDFSNTEEGRKTVSELQQILKAFGRKSLLEEQYFLPALALQAPYVLSLVEEEKKQVKELSARLARCLQNYVQPGTSGHYQLAGLSIQQTYMEFLSFMLIYMNRQESLFNGLVSFDNASSLIMESDENGGWEFFSWMLKGMNNREIAEWLENDSALSYNKKRALLGTLSPERLQAAGVESDFRTKGVLFAA